MFKVLLDEGYQSAATIAFLDENTLFGASKNEAITWRAPSFDEIETIEKANAQK